MRSRKNIDVLILTENIDSIWNQVYSVNESMSVSKRRELILGFEDGINEIFGKWAAKAMNFKDKLVGGAKSAFSSMVAKGNEFYEKGKKLAGKAWEKIKEFAGNVMKKIKESYGRALDAISAGYQNFKLSVTKAYQYALTSINQAYESMKDKATSFAEACKGIWSDILEESALLIQATKEKFTAMKEGFSRWFDKNKADLEKSAREAKSSGISSMVKLGEMISASLEKGAKVASDAGAVALFICVSPIILLVNGVKAIPGVYDSAVGMIRAFVEKEAAEYSANRVEESLRYIKTFEGFKY